MPEVIIGIDAEWQSGDAANTILSYQWYGIDGDRCWSGIYYPEHDKPEDKRRLKLQQSVSLILQDEYKGRAWPDVLSWRATTHRQKHRLSLHVGGYYCFKWGNKGKGFNRHSREIYNRCRHLHRTETCPRMRP